MAHWPHAPVTPHTEASDDSLSVSFPAGVFTDPNDDLNPATSVDVTGPS